MKDSIDQAFIEDVKSYVLGLLNTHLSPKLTFHTSRHTLNVLKSATEIAKKSNVDDHNLELVKIAALFHDVGYIRSYDEHERYSADMAREFLVSKGFAIEDIETVCSAIMATAIPQNPKHIVAEILCDADLMHLAADDYFDQTAPIKKEWDNIGRAKLNENDFLKTSLAFFDAHHYHTVYGRKTLAPLKAENRRRILEKLATNSVEN